MTYILSPDPEQRAKWREEANRAAKASASTSTK